jgi:hypothetical protein
MRFQTRRRVNAVLLALVLGVGMAGCLTRVRRPIQVATIEAPASSVPTVVRSPVRLHLTDLSVVAFPSGASVTADSVYGVGQRWDVRLQNMRPVTAVPMDSVVGMEAMAGGGFNTPVSVLLTAAATAAGVVGTAGMMVVIFGSCPTVYSGVGHDALLEGESFSYSIAPLLEARDVDVVRHAVIVDGRVEFEIRNEALETHFINQFELLVTDLSANETIYPDVAGLPVALSGVVPVAATDRSGRDVSAQLAERDEMAYETPPALIAGGIAGDPRDHVEMSLPGGGADTAYVVVRLRNSLLTTLLFYNVMMEPAGAAAADWVGEDLGRVGSAAALGAWYRRWMGLRAEVFRDGSWQEVGRLPDSGPIAWEEVAIAVPTGGQPTRFRLSFVADQWRIDRVGLATEARRPTVRALAPARIVALDGSPLPGELSALAQPDRSYLETRPGQAFRLEFDLPADARSEGLLLASQGYYTEWIRRDWLRTGRPDARFKPTDAVIPELLERWTRERADLEGRFFATRLPVR